MWTVPQNPIIQDSVTRAIKTSSLNADQHTHIMSDDLDLAEQATLLGYYAFCTHAPRSSNPFCSSSEDIAHQHWNLGWDRQDANDDLPL